MINIRYLFYLILSCFLLLSGCNFLPEPTSLIQAPAHVLAETDPDESLRAIAKSHLPKGTELFIPNAPIGTDSVLSSDFNSDGQEEIIGLYQSNENKNQVGVLALMKKNEAWQKVLARKGSGYEISWASANDLTGDGGAELILGWKVGNLAGNLLEIYTWENEGFKLIEKMNYHEVEVIRVENDKKYRLALWKKDVDDSYEVELLKWDTDRFVVDIDHYPSYFPKVIQYYEGRTDSVPNSALYWYFLADAYLKADHPELAMNAILKGMRNKIVIPSYDEFQQLQKKIEARFAEVKKDILYEVPHGALYLHIPKEIAPYILIEEESGLNMNYKVTVSVSPNEKEKKNLFTVEIYSKDMIMEDPRRIRMENLTETERFLYYLERNKDDFISNDPSTKEIYEKAFALKDRIIQSVTPGAFHPQVSSFEDEMMIEMVKEATNKYWYVVSGGKMNDGLIQSFLIHDLDYRYMGSDFDTKSKLVTYLSHSYTADSIGSFIKRAGIVEHNGKLAQPNADGGSLVSFEKAIIMQSSGNGLAREVDLMVPLGNSLISEFVHVEFQKTHDGWRISSEPGTF